MKPASSLPPKNRSIGNTKRFGPSLSAAANRVKSPAGSVTLRVPFGFFATSFGMTRLSEAPFSRMSDTARRWLRLEIE